MHLTRGSKVFLAFLVFATALVLGALYAFTTDTEDDDADETVTVEVPEGMRAGEVAGLLEDEGVINNAWAFRIAARFDERSGRIRPGTYDLHTSMDTGDILDVLSQGPPMPDSFSFTIPEGLTVPATLERIAEAEASPFGLEELEEALLGVPVPEWVPDIDLPEGAQAHEGLLFPATYEFFVDQDAQEVLAKMIAETDDVVDAVQPEHLDAYEVLIAASLIEREVRVPEERPVVSSVIANRLGAGMRLQIDASVQYARGEHTGRLLFDDLEIDSAWNTYESDGLPPTPIAAPGRAAIEAAANPADTDYHYYVVCDTETGEHAFAEGDQGHQENVARFREIQDDGGRFCEQ